MGEVSKILFGREVIFQCCVLIWMTVLQQYYSKAPVLVFSTKVC